MLFRPPGTTRSRHRFFSEEIYFAVSKIHGFTILYGGFECEGPEVFCKHCPRKVDALSMLSGCEINSRILVKRETAKVRNSSSVRLPRQRFAGFSFVIWVT